MIDNQAAPAVHCDVQANATAGRITLQGRVVAVAERAARYSLVVNKDGTSGLSTVKQTGEFHTLAGQPVFVGSVVLDYQKATQYRAELIVIYEGEPFNCNFKSGDFHD